MPKIRQFMNQQEPKKDDISVQNLGADINLVGFNALPPEELNIAKKIIGNHIKQIKEKTDFKSIKLQLRVHDKGESALNELAAQAIIGNENFGTKFEGWNLHEVIGKVMETLLAEAIKSKRTPKEINESIIRKKFRK